ncbi:MAG: helix-turn-helix domain-containing protein [Nanoarchaeota archaeon]
MNKQYLFYPFIPIMERGYNIHEIKILQLVFEKKRNISEISRELNIDYKNTHRYVNKLHKEGLIIIEPSKPIQGKKVFVTLSEKTLSEILNELEAILLRKDNREEIINIIKEAKRKLRYIQLLDKQQK